MSATDLKIPQLIGDVVTNLGEIVSKEFKLARAEIKKGMGQVGGGAAMIGLGLACFIPALTVLALAAVAIMVENGVAASLSSLIVALVLGVLGFVFYKAGKARINHASGLEATSHNLQKDVETLKEAAHGRN